MTYLIVITPDRYSTVILKGQLILIVLTKPGLDRGLFQVRSPTLSASPEPTRFLYLIHLGSCNGIRTTGIK